jgi:ribosomal protein S18 acetylase RimI-like enzyme
MVQPEYAEWLDEIIPAYAADKVSSGQWSEEDSVELSKKEYGELLPLGLGTPDNYLYTIVDVDLHPVGVLWFAVKTKNNARIAYVYDVSVKPESRRKGHAYAAFIALEDEVRRLGLSGIALHVFGHNLEARDLYAKLGFHPTNINLYKAIAVTGA